MSAQDAKVLVTVDMVIPRLSPSGSGWEIILIQRNKQPYQGMWALPGGHLTIEDTSSEAAAQRETLEETGLNIPLHLFKQVYTFEDFEDPRGKYLCLLYVLSEPLNPEAKIEAGDDASHVQWYPAEDLQQLPDLAFNHIRLIRMALRQMFTSYYDEALGLEETDTCPCEIEISPGQYCSNTAYWRYNNIAICPKHIQSVVKKQGSVSSINIPLNAPPYIRQAATALDSVIKNDRKEAIEILATAHHSDAHNILIAALHHPTTDVRQVVITALGEIKDPTAIPALQEALYDPEWEVRLTAAWALGEIKDPTVIPALQEALHGSEWMTRRAAAWALGEIKDPTAIPALQETLHDPEKEVRQAAITALGEIKDPTAIPALQEALHDPEGEIRQAAITTLGKIKDPTIIPALQEALHDPEWKTRRAAAWALGEIKDPTAIPALQEALHDPEGGVRRVAAWALDVDR